MNISKLFTAAVCIVIAVFMCVQSCFADVMNAELPERVGIAIDVNEGVYKVNKTEYIAVVYPGQNELVLTGIWDGEHHVTVSMRSSSTTEAIDFEYFDDGTWKCTIPAEILSRTEDNYLELRYTDDGQLCVNCRINLDYECELELFDVYAADNCVSGVTEPYAAVKLVCGREEHATAAGSDGSFSFEIDAAMIMAADRCYVMAEDAGGNTAVCDVAVKDAGIVVYAEPAGEPGCAEVIIRAIAGSSVQLTINGEALGEPLRIDTGGMASITVRGLEHGGEYEISAVYAGSFEGSGEEAKPVSIIIDIKGPVIIASDSIIYTDAGGMIISADEECMLTITAGEDEIGYGFVAMAGENTIVFSDIDGFPALEAGMRLTVTAVDAAGNSELQSAVLVVYPAAEQAVDAGLAYGSINVVDSMERLEVSGTVQVAEAGCTMDIYLAVDGGKEKLNDGPMVAVEGENGFYIGFSCVIDQNEMPRDTDFGLMFDIAAADGKEIYAGGIVYELRAEKDFARLIPYCILLALSAACFAAALYLYIRLDRRQAALRRISGFNRRGRRAERRGRA